MILQELRHYSDAVKHYRKALEIIPNYPEAEGNLGDALMQLGRHREGLAHGRRGNGVIEFNWRAPSTFSINTGEQETSA